MQQQTAIFKPELIRAVVGLGNPGPKYARTRHNIGFMVVDELARQMHTALREQGIWEVGNLAVGDHALLLAKPLTFMNESGKVFALLKKAGIAAEQVLVVHDELELPFGKIAIRFGGSARGHNGLRSFIAHMGEGYWRMRVGIGRPERKEDVGHYVLEPFLPAEQATLPEVVAKAVALLEPALRGAL